MPPLISLSAAIRTTIRTTIRTNAYYPSLVA
jgi:hypothetical protein